MRGYTPKARLLDDDPFSWENARQEGLRDWLELDLYDAVRTDVKEFITRQDNTVWKNLRNTATWGKLAQYLSESFVAHICPHLADGRQALYDQVIDNLREPALEPEIKFQLLDNTVNILGRVANLKLSSSIEIRPLAAGLRSSSDRRYQEAAQQFMEQLTDRK